jgi:hypothetical protein
MDSLRKHSLNARKDRSGPSAVRLERRSLRDLITISQVEKQATLPADCRHLFLGNREAAGKDRT